jgi:hypothetical protein
MVFFPRGISVIKGQDMYRLNRFDGALDYTVRSKFDQPKTELVLVRPLGVTEFAGIILGSNQTAHSHSSFE